MMAMSQRHDAPQHVHARSPGAATGWRAPSPSSRRVMPELALNVSMYYARTGHYPLERLAPSNCVHYTCVSGRVPAACASVDDRESPGIHRHFYYAFSSGRTHPLPNRAPNF
jgi:hypothetical protein